MDEKRADMLANASAQRWRDNTVEQVVRTALSTAKAETAKWYDTQVAQIPTDQERLIAALRTLDAMTSVLPAEVRGKLGGVTKLASLKTDEARARALLEKLDKIDKVLEQWLRKEFRGRINKLFDRSQVKGGSGKKPKGTLGADVHELMWSAENAAGLTGEEVGGQACRTGQHSQRWDAYQ